MHNALRRGRIAFDARGDIGIKDPGTHATIDLARDSKPDELRILVVVDGPPGATGKHARYPAVPAVLAHFFGAQIDNLLDAYIREDEKEIARLWLADTQEMELQFIMTKKSMEKDACLITITRCPTT